MNTDDFEKRLQRQTLRDLPGEWREQILSTASEQRRSASGDIRRLLWKALSIPWNELIFPSRRIWAGLATVWVVIVFVNVQDTRHHKIASHNFTPPSTAVLMAWREQEQWLTEFAGPHEAREADRPKKVAPTPRSDWHGKLFQA